MTFIFCSLSLFETARYKRSIKPKCRKTSLLTEVGAFRSVVKTWPLSFFVRGTRGLFAHDALWRNLGAWLQKGEKRENTQSLRHIWGRNFSSPSSLLLYHLSQSCNCSPGDHVLCPAQVCGFHLLHGKLRRAAQLLLTKNGFSTLWNLCLGFGTKAQLPLFRLQGFEFKTCVNWCTWSNDIHCSPKVTLAIVLLSVLIGGWLTY